MPKAQPVEHIIEQTLGRAGRIRRLLPGFEIRDGQLELARGVAQVLASGGTLVVEAPTGIGKSLGYLVPAAVHSVSQRVPVVVATHTRNLQDQLIEKDIALATRVLESYLEEPLLVTVVKGRSNYLCRRRWEGARREADDLGLAAGKVASLARWVESTTTGELSEAEEWVGPLGAARERLAAETGACAWGRCQRGAACFQRRLRDRLRRSHLIIVNHALLFAHLLRDGTFLPDADGLILDEAHRVESALLSAIGREVSRRRVLALSRRSEGQARGDGGDFARLQRSIATLESVVDRVNLLERLGRTRRAVEAAGEAVVDCMDELRRRFASVVELPLRYACEPGERVAGVEVVIDEVYREALRLAEDAHQSLRNLIAAIDEVDARNAGALEDGLPVALGLTGAWGELAVDLAALASPREDEVCWVEGTDQELSLRSLPLTVGRHMAELVQSRFRSVVLTSATLTVAQSFEHMIARLGLDRGVHGAPFTIQLDSPFDYPKNCRLFVDATLPLPESPCYATALVATVIELAEQVEQSTMILFTSWSLLRRVHRALLPVCARLGRPLVAQGIDGPRRVVARSHRRRRGSILLGTQSFWEGVDFPGGELELLVLTRLPFPVPSEPLIAARGDRLRLDGRSPFNELFLPESILRFRQGFGRLIRSRYDRGAVLCLDPRLALASYGHLFAASLPVEPVVVEAGCLAAATRTWLCADGAPESAVPWSHEDDTMGLAPRSAVDEPPPPSRDAGNLHVERP